MECTNKACQYKGNNEAAYYVDFEIGSDIGTIRNMEYLCEKCAVNVLSYGLAYRSKTHFKLNRYMSIDDHDRLINTFV